MNSNNEWIIFVLKIFKLKTHLTPHFGGISKPFTHCCRWVHYGYYHEITSADYQRVDMGIVIVCDLYSVSPAHGSAFVTLSWWKRWRHG